MATVLTTLLLVCCIFYAGVQYALMIGLFRMPFRFSNNEPFVSVIVAARNEELNIERLFACLSAQEYRNFEIIFVNDRSTDRTAEKVAEFSFRRPAIKIVTIGEVPPDMPAKKNALNAGIREAKGEILCFTDADCFPPPAWLANIVRSFEPEIGLTAGFSPYEVPEGGSRLKRLFFKFIAYEEFRAGIWSGGSIGWNLGWLCTGRSLAYRASIFKEVGGFESIKHSISGDDDLFLQHVRRTTNWKMHYVMGSESHVPTLPPANFRQFVRQRKRHFSAAQYFTFPMKCFFAAYHFSNFMLFCTLPALFFLPASAFLLSVCFFVKVLSDAILIGFGSRKFGVKRMIPEFLWMEVFYLFYNIGIGPLGLIFSFDWKPAAK
jgi:cellulose synthase/poly-beta-1,6-N-acetylglucosamine synthase-like glycosyltransferase